MRWTGMFVAAAAAMLVAASPAAADTFTVGGTGDNTDGCNGTACASLRSALSAATANPGADTIVLPAGTYNLTRGELLVDSPVTITGDSARTTSVTSTASDRL